MTKKLFVGNLPFSMSQDQLTAIFAPYGTVVSANIVSDRFSGRSKGFGFVEFEKDEDAMKAITELNDSEQDGRKIAVKEAIAREEQPVQPVEAVSSPVKKETEEMEPIGIPTDEPIEEPEKIEEPTV